MIRYGGRSMLMNRCNYTDIPAVTEYKNNVSLELLSPRMDSVFDLLQTYADMSNIRYAQIHVHPRNTMQLGKIQDLRHNVNDNDISNIREKSYYNNMSITKVWR